MKEQVFSAVPVTGYEIQINNTEIAAYIPEGPEAYKYAALFENSPALLLAAERALTELTGSCLTRNYNANQAYEELREVVIKCKGQKV